MPVTADPAEHTCCDAAAAPSCCETPAAGAGAGGCCDGPPPVARAQLPGLGKALAWEPYRLLFAIGLLHLIGALALWPFAALTGWLFQPGPAHVALAVHGFMACFVAGFLGTFAPRLLGAAWTGPRQTGTLVAVAAAGFLAALLGSATALAAVHVVLYAWLLLFALRCLVAGRERPPARMLVAGLALAAGLVAAAVQVLGAAIDLPAAALRWSSLLQTQGVLLMLVVGIAGLLLPRFATGGGCSAGVGTSRQPYGRYAFGAVLLLASYAVEAVWTTRGLAGTGVWRAAFAVRALVALLLVWPALRLPRGSAGWLRAGQCAVGSILLGLALPALWPGYLMAWNHLIFVTGFLWLTLAVATKVVCAHGGAGALLERSGRPMTILGALIVLGMVTRIGAEWSATTYHQHLWLGALLVLAAIGYWIRRYGGLLFVLPWRR